MSKKLFLFGFVFLVLVSVVSANHVLVDGYDAIEYVLPTGGINGQSGDQACQQTFGGIGEGGDCVKVQWKSGRIRNGVREAIPNRPWRDSTVYSCSRSVSSSTTTLYRAVCNGPTLAHVANDPPEAPKLTCTNECNIGQVNCVAGNDDTVQTCQDLDGDGCTEWVSSHSCNYLDTRENLIGATRTVAINECQFRRVRDFEVRDHHCTSSTPNNFCSSYDVTTTGEKTISTVTEADGTACGNGGSCQSGECIFPEPQITRFDLNKNGITVGETITVSWDSRNANSCELIRIPVGKRGTRTSSAIRTPGNVPIILTCTGRGGSVEQRKTLTVIEVPTTPPPGPGAVVSTPTDLTGEACSNNAFCRSEGQNLYCSYGEDDRKQIGEQGYCCGLGRYAEVDRQDNANCIEKTDFTECRECSVKQSTEGRFRLNGIGQIYKTRANLPNACREGNRICVTYDDYYGQGEKKILVTPELY